MKTEAVKIKQVKTNPNNPRFIKDDKFKKLVRSIKEFPEMLELRPIVVDKDNIVLGGNMRLRACKEAGLKEVHILKADQLTEEQQREFIIKDNVGFGEWDWDNLANEWDTDRLEDWGLDLPLGYEESEEKYTNKIGSPNYTPSETKPEINKLIDIDKANILISKIKKTELSKEVKDFLIFAAYRHVVFDYAFIAEYYCHSDKIVQELMEESALIVIDFNKAIENGYVELTKTLQDLYSEDYG